MGLELALSFRNKLRECVRCDLHSGCTAPVPWSGGVGVEVAVIGEAPGRSEDVAGEPFIGSAGTRLRMLLPKAGLDPTKVAYVNAVQCYPKRGLDDHDDKKYIDVCRSWMRGQIAFIQPKYIITVGRVAFRSVFDRTWPKLRELHGKPMYWDNYPAPARPVAVWPTYHPSAALRSGKFQRMIEEDLVAFKNWRANGEEFPSVCYVCGGELYRYAGDGIALCERHAARQGILWPEDAA